MKVQLVIDGIEYNCVPKIINKERIKNEIEERFIQFEQGMNKYGIGNLVSIFYEHVLSHYRSLVISYLVPKLNLTRNDTREVLYLAMRCNLLASGNNCKYIIPADERESILQLLKERSKI
jgi:hypothetical protein